MKKKRIKFITNKGKIVYIKKTSIYDEYVKIEQKFAKNKKIPTPTIIQKQIVSKINEKN